MRRSPTPATRPSATHAGHPGQSSRALREFAMARIRNWAGALGEVAQSGPLRRAQASFGVMWASESAFMVGLAVVAFRDGGVVAVGLVTGVRIAAGSVIAPL